MSDILIKNLAMDSTTREAFVRGYCAGLTEAAAQVMKEHRMGDDDRWIDLATSLRQVANKLGDL